MSIITDITKQKKRTDIYNVFVDGTFFCSLSDLQLSLAGLRVGEDVEESRLTQLKESSSFTKLYNRALYYLSFRPRSVYEIRHYLSDKADDETQVEPVIAKLEEQKLADDETFAQNWVENRNLIKPRSRRQLEQELRQKGVDRDVIESVLSEQTDIIEQENIRLLLAKKQRTSKSRDDQKLIRYLSTKGFRYSDIRAVLEAGAD